MHRDRSGVWPRHRPVPLCLIRSSTSPPDFDLAKREKVVWILWAESRGRTPRDACVALLTAARPGSCQPHPRANRNTSSRREFLKTVSGCGTRRDEFSLANHRTRGVRQKRSRSRRQSQIGLAGDRLRLRLVLENIGRAVAPLSTAGALVCRVEMQGSETHPTLAHRAIPALWEFLQQISLRQVDRAVESVA